ncbi:hypothetical protein [Microbacterium flavescens]|uniref:hypothetical protein n=1 Tax=Microbacterium flavescens TaxID=69366 RepID=UPI001BDE7F77|nr:hypothetical protein [Microbacterium flavescens]BFF10352.1 hypothetical protein GCM10025699_16550 [Microbacterium flavescens]
MSESNTDLVTLWEAAQRVMATTGNVERATNETVRREWAAIDAELIRLGIPTRDPPRSIGTGTGVVDRTERHRSDHRDLGRVL